jgi:predicted kinase
MTTLYLTRGIPGSGKSTYAKKWVQEAPESRVRISRDDLRGMLYATPDKLLSPAQEQHVSAIEKSIAITSLAAGKDVVIDATNLNPRFVRAWLHLGFPVETVDFPVTIREALERNARREHPIPAEAIRRMFRRFTVNGDIPALPAATPSEPWKYEQDWQLDSAFIVDIDGTLAHNNGGRSYYDMTRVGEDDVDVAVRDVVNALHQSHHIVLLSGRDETARAETVKWLDANFVSYDALHMRADGDGRRDDVIKPELFDRHIRDRFNVLGVIDDRPSVCRAWRMKGVKTFQVGDPANEF